MVEKSAVDLIKAHVLAYIRENPGCTSTDLAKKVPLPAELRNHLFLEMQREGMIHVKRVKAITKPAYHYYPNDNDN